MGFHLGLRAPSRVSSAHLEAAQHLEGRRVAAQIVCQRRLRPHQMQHRARQALRRPCSVIGRKAQIVTACPHTVIRSRCSTRNTTACHIVIGLWATHSTACHIVIGLQAQNITRCDIVIRLQATNTAACHIFGALSQQRYNKPMHSRSFSLYPTAQAGFWLLSKQCPRPRCDASA